MNQKFEKPVLSDPRTRRQSLAGEAASAWKCDSADVTLVSRCQPPVVFSSHTDTVCQLVTILDKWTPAGGGMNDPGQYF